MNPSIYPHLVHWSVCGCLFSICFMLFCAHIWWIVFFFSSLFINKTKHSSVRVYSNIKAILTPKSEEGGERRGRVEARRGIHLLCVLFANWGRKVLFLHLFNRFIHISHLDRDEACFLLLLFRSCLLLCFVFVPPASSYRLLFVCGGWLHVFLLSSPFLFSFLWKKHSNSSLFFYYRVFWSRCIHVAP